VSQRSRSSYFIDQPERSIVSHLTPLQTTFVCVRPALAVNQHLATSFSSLDVTGSTVHRPCRPRPITKSGNKETQRKWRTTAATLRCYRRTKCRRFGAALIFPCPLQIEHDGPTTHSCNIDHPVDDRQRHKNCTWWTTPSIAPIAGPPHGVTGRKWIQFATRILQQVTWDGRTTINCSITWVQYLNEFN